MDTGKAMRLNHNADEFGIIRVILDGKHFYGGLYHSAPYLYYCILTRQGDDPIYTSKISLAVSSLCDLSYMGLSISYVSVSVATLKVLRGVTESWIK